MASDSTILLTGPTDIHMASIASGAQSSNNYGSIEEGPMEVDGIHVVMRFDLDSLPAGWTVDSAVLALVFDDSDAWGNPDANDSALFRLFDLKRSFSEGNNTGAAADSFEVSWDSALTSITDGNWATAGAESGTSDMDSTSFASFWIHAGNVSADGDTVTVTIPAATVYAWQVLNYGFVMHMDTLINGWSLNTPSWYHDNDANSDNHPSVTFYLTQPANDWGKANLQDPDSMYVSWIRGSVPTLNYGIATTSQVTGDAVPTTAGGVTLMRMVTDPRTAGYTQDSIQVYVWHVDASSDPTTEPNYLWLYLHGMNKTWNEGNENGAAADSGDVNWTAAITKSDGTDSVAWGSPGAQAVFGDRTQFPICSVLVDANRTDGFLKFTIPAAKITDSIFTYGIQIRTGPSDLTYQGVLLISDDHATVIKRPYWAGFESPAAAVEGGPWGAGTVGAKTTGP